MAERRALEKGFDKRTFDGVGHGVRQMLSMLANVRELGRDAREGLVEPAFRERLMLAVTSVNECRYCSFAHAKAALEAGVPTGEVEGLLCGSVDGCPEGEGPALLYAVHWAEARGGPDPLARARMVETYGEERTRAIERALRAIETGNLLGNSIDYILYRLTFGRVGDKRSLLGARSRRGRRGGQTSTGDV
jgi:AhpD family alkylhydroperoxidase